MVDPICEDCKGTGKILLLTKTVKCYCVDREIDLIEIESPEPEVDVEWSNRKDFDSFYGPASI